MLPIVLYLLVATRDVGSSQQCLDVTHAANRAASHLRSSTLPAGQFVYARNQNPIAPVNDRYNIIRHAGTIYSLADYASENAGEENRATIRSSVRFLVDQIHPKPGSDTLLALWSLPQIEGTRSLRPKAKLGGTGYALVALLYAQGVIGPQVSDDSLACLGNFLLSMQDTTGRFHSIYEYGRGIDEDFESLYYPGEAAFGLTLLYEHDSNPVWLHAAAKGLEYLGRSREGEAVVPWDHWALVSTGRLMRHIDHCDPSVGRQIILDHAMQLVRSILYGRPTELYDRDLSGFFTSDRRTTGTSTMLEGLLAIRPWISDERLRADCDDTIERGVSFLLSAQIMDGPLRGGFPRIHPVHARALDDVDASEVRIDYVHHALSALLEYHRAFCRARLP